MVSFAVILSSLYWSTIYGPATSPRWAFLAVSLPILLLLKYEKVNFTILHLLGLSFLVWSTLSLFWTSNVYDGLDELIKLIILAQIFVLGSYLKSLREIFIGLAVGLTCSSILVIFGVKAGLFVNVNILAETALIVCVGLFVYKLWWLIPGLLPSIILNGSRAAILTGAILFCGWIWSKSKLVSALFIATILLICIISIYYGYKIESINERLIIYSDITLGLKLFGNGLGSFFSAYPYLTSEIDTVLSRPRFAHNDLLQIAFETGVIGIGLVAVIIFYMRQNYVFASFIAISLFSFPFHLPVTAFIAALVCGFTTREWSSVRLLSYDGRKLLLARGVETSG